MPLDERGEQAVFFIGEGSLPRTVIEEGDEATLYHDGNLVMATIMAIKANKMVGLITRSAYDPDLHQDYILGKEIHFSGENIFGMSKKKRQG